VESFPKRVAGQKVHTPSIGGDGPSVPPCSGEQISSAVTRLECLQTGRTATDT
jgi:hypothetical protein